MAFLMVSRTLLPNCHFWKFVHHMPRPVPPSSLNRGKLCILLAPAIKGVMINWNLSNNGRIWYAYCMWYFSSSSKDLLNKEQVIEYSKYSNWFYSRITVINKNLYFMNLIKSPLKQNTFVNPILNTFNWFCNAWAFFRTISRIVVDSVGGRLSNLWMVKKG